MIEAAAYYGRKAFVPILERLLASSDDDDRLLERAIAHCNGKVRDALWWRDRVSGNDNAL